MTKKLNASRMRKLVKEFRASDQSATEFASAHGLTKSTLYYWISKLEKLPPPVTPLTTPKKDFLAVEIAPEQGSGNIMIRLKSGVEIEIPLQMFALGTSHNFQLYNHPTDMRKSFDSLRGLVINDLDQNPDNGTVYIFINKVRNKVKLLHWQSGGFMLYYKRLESGTFELPEYDDEVGSLRLSYAQLILLIDGISITNLSRRNRYEKM